ncbi:thiamine diphosphate-binding protein [Halenospora varia]|nr:thiamine diphosphate-binding protein [Halenospora varia]
MVSIANGIAAYNRGTFVPVTSRFFMFYLYAAPGVRMGPSKSSIIHIATDDSIGTGEDGLTHQPIELAALYQATPNLLYIWSCDSEEGAGVGPEMCFAVSAADELAKVASRLELKDSHASACSNNKVGSTEGVYCGAQRCQ